MKKLLILSSIIVIALAGCNKDFLNRNNLTQTITNITFWQNGTDATLAINGIYDALQATQLYGGNLNGDAGLPMYDDFGDNCYNGFKYEGPGNYMIAIANPVTTMFKNMWAQNYAGINRANNCISHINEMTSSQISDSLKQQLLGQAYFLRGLMYMNLAVYFQDVPLVLTVQQVQDSYVPKAPYADVAKQIITDFKAASTMLPVSYPASQYGYATKGAALGLLARFYLYNHDYQNAFDATTPMLSMGYSLFSNYATLFTPTNETVSEIVFSIRFVNNSIQSGELFSATFTNVPKIDQQPMPNLIKDYYCTDGKPITSSPLYNPSKEKNNRDSRLSASYYFKTDTFITTPITIFNGGTTTTYGQRKYLRTATSTTSTSVFGAGSQDFYVLRYADVLLMRAEAMIELNQLSGVTPLINQVRARVGMPSVETAEGIGLSQDKLRSVVRHERRVELALEGLRYFDLKRWGLVQQAFTTAIADNIAGYIPIYMGPKSEVFPIPQSELDANPSLTQNPAWQ